MSPKPVDLDQAKVPLTNEVVCLSTLEFEAKRIRTDFLDQKCEFLRLIRAVARHHHPRRRTFCRTNVETARVDQINLK